MIFALILSRLNTTNCFLQRLKKKYHLTTVDNISSILYGYETSSYDWSKN